MVGVLSFETHSDKVTFIKLQYQVSIFINLNEIGFVNLVEFYMFRLNEFFIIFLIYR